MPIIGQPRVNTHIMSILCNAMKFNVRRGILTGNGTRFRRRSGIGEAEIGPGGPKPGLFGLGFEVRFTAKFVMPGLVPGIHVSTAHLRGRRGWPGQSPAMTKSETRTRFARLVRAK